ncbi:hypothetical protein Syun_006672 [Stephania yunnanensis]|uniref:Aminotransferase-like plant mobile domain-containing protein n=1 Tax=Stephania yunnanensis TaxID=152371 RepID=A0AAP0Q1K9_9MAGN
MILYFFLELYFWLCSKRLHFVVFLGIARSKTTVTREEVGVEVSRGNRGRGGRRPPTSSYRKEKENVDVKGNAKVDGNRARNLQLHDEGSNIDTRRRKDLVVARGKEEGHASESSSSDSSAAANTTETDRNVGGSSSGGGDHNEGEPQEPVNMRAPFPGGPLDDALLKSFKDHVALAIWSNEVFKISLNGKLRVFTKMMRSVAVTWDPYVNYMDNGVVDAMTFYSGTLKYMDVVEPYHPERILRQFDHVQSIPDPPYRPLKAHRGPSANKYTIKYGSQQDNWERWRNYLLAPEVHGDKAEFEFLATPDYLPWFHKVSHPLITNPSHEDEDMVATTIVDNELLERNRRALDATL